MQLTTEQTEFIRRDIEKRGVTLGPLADSLTDHICCTIENSPATDFYSAYHSALAAFGQNGLQQTQQNTIFLLYLKKELVMKRTMYVLGYIALFLCSTAMAFKTMHWPGANVMLVLGVVILNLGFLPMYFYSRYRQAIG